MKKILILLISLASSFQLFADRDLSSEISGFLESHRILNIDFNKPQNSLDLMSETSRFIKRVGVENILNSRQGKELLARQKKLKNAFLIKGELANCGNSRRRLGERLTLASSTASHCELYNSIEEEPVFNSQKFLQKVIDQEVHSLNEMKKSGYYDVILNSARTVWEYDRQFGEREYGRTDNYVKEFCDSINKNSCKDPSLVKKLQDARRKFEIEASYRDSPNIDKAVEHYKNNLKQINTNLELIKDKDSDTSKLAYSIYEVQYQQLLSSKLGGIFLTRSMNEKVGGFRTFDNIKVKKRSRRKMKRSRVKEYYMPQHGVDISKEDLRKAYHELRKETLNGIHDIHKEYRKAAPHSFLKELMKTYPASLGVTLLKNPHMASLVCELISDIEKSDAQWAGVKKVAVIGGIVLGTAAAITLVGSGVAAALYTASAAAAGTGTAAAASLSASASTALLIGGVATGVGFALGVGETALWSYESYRTKLEMNKLRVALLSKTTDEAGVQEVQNLMKEHERAVQRALIAGVFTALDVLAFTKIARITGDVIAKSGGRGIRAMVNSVDNLISLMRENKKVRSLIKYMGKFFKESNGGFGQLVGKLGGMREKIMRNFLLNMSDLSEKEVEKILRRMFSCGN